MGQRQRQQTWSGFLEDHAAKYLPEQNRLQINADFRVFTDMIERFAKRYPDVPGATSVIEETVCEWFEQTLIETILGVQTLTRPCLRPRRVLRPAHDML